MGELHNKMWIITIVTLCGFSGLLGQRTFRRSCDCEYMEDGKCAYTLLLPTTQNAAEGKCPTNKNMDSQENIMGDVPRDIERTVQDLHSNYTDLNMKYTQHATMINQIYSTLMDKLLKCNLLMQCISIDLPTPPNVEIPEVTVPDIDIEVPVGITVPDIDIEVPIGITVPDMDVPTPDIEIPTINPEIEMPDVTLDPVMPEIEPVCLCSDVEAKVVSLRKELSVYNTTLYELNTKFLQSQADINIEELKEMMELLNSTLLDLMVQFTNQMIKQAGGGDLPSPGEAELGLPVGSPPRGEPPKTGGEPGIPDDSPPSNIGGEPISPNAPPSGDRFAPGGETPNTGSQFDFPGGLPGTGDGGFGTRQGDGDTTVPGGETPNVGREFPLPGGLPPPGAGGANFNVAAIIQQMLNPLIAQFNETIRNTTKAFTEMVNSGAICVKKGPLVSGENERILDSMITSSSYFNENHFATRVRINTVQQLDLKGAWCPGNNSKSDAQGEPNLPGTEWIQFDLGRPRPVYGVVTRGRSDYEQWVETYMVHYAMTMHSDPLQTIWLPVQDMLGLGDVIFDGNKDQNSPKFQYFDNPIVARYFRIIPLTAYADRNRCMRADLIGCVDAP